MTTNPRSWIIMPIRAHRDYTIAAINDCLAQIESRDFSVSVTLLLINQGVDDAFRDELEQLAEQEPHVLLWSHMPPLPSLAATWNRALRCAWEAGATEALVVNNDVRLRPDTVSMLSTVLDQTDALFVSAVGVTAKQYAAAQSSIGTPSYAIDLVGDLTQKGGPDFSCFLIRKECHDRFPFDEGFIPAHCEDCSYHRELMLAGEGTRIFSVNLPFLHHGATTLKTLPKQEANRLSQQVEQIARAHYARCWGGPVNSERYLIKGDPSSAREGVTNPELQAAVADDAAFHALIGDGRSST